MSQISFAAKDSEFSDWDGDILAVAVTDKDVQVQPHVSGSEFENAVLRRLDVQLGGLLRAAAAEEEFAGRPGQSVVLRVRGQRFKRVALVGFAARDRDRDAGCLHGLGESVASVARAARATSAAILVADPAVVRPESRLNAAAAIASGTVPRDALLADAGLIIDFLPLLCFHLNLNCILQELCLDCTRTTDTSPSGKRCI